MKIECSINSEKVLAAFRRAPETMNRSLDKGLDRAAVKMARTAQDKLRDNGSIAFSTLIQSISSRRVGQFTRIVEPAAKYAVFVEEGTKPGYMPNGYALAAWLKVRGAANPKRQSFALAKHIFRHGTKAHPFWEPAFNDAEPEMRQIIGRAVAQGIREAFV